MRIRLRLLLPLVLAAVVAAGFLVLFLTVGPAIRSAPSDTAAAAAARLILLWGLVSILLAAVVGWAVARLIARPLAVMREAAERLPDAREPLRPGTPVAEVQDIVRGIQRAGDELRERHGRELRERSELAALVDAVSEGIIHLDGEARVVRANRAGRRLLGLPATPEGRPVGALVRNTELRRLMVQAGTGRRFEAVEVVVDDRRILASMAPLPAGGAVATLVDLTDLRRLEEVRRDFVANASHELKTPLTSIRGYSETLLDGNLPDPERRQFLETIARNAARLQRVVDDLLDLSRLESGGWRPDVQDLDIAEAATLAWEPFAERARQKGVGFDLRVPESEPRALADRNAMEQVFSNLYDNALRHTPRDGMVRVAVGRDGPQSSPAPGTGRRAPEAAPDGPWIVIEVADTGSGIPRDALPRVFERFYRVDPARSRSEGGTGLGLSIVRHMIESMGGAVSAESELGKGTTFRLWLPAPR